MTLQYSDDIEARRRFVNFSTQRQLANLPLSDKLSAVADFRIWNVLSRPRR